MKKLLLILIAFMVFSSHDMFLKLDTYLLQPNKAATIKLFNGTFDSSENVIDRNRMIDVSLVGQGKRTQVDTTQWRDDAGTTLLSFTTGEPGTWVAGVSTRPRNIEMAAEDFNDYLAHDGVLDMLESRKANNALDQDAVEKYSKHVKTIFQVGDKRTTDWQTNLGYPIEFIPQQNPYDLKKGETLEVKLLWKGDPLANQLVYIGNRSSQDGHSHDHSHEHKHEGEEAHSHDHDENAKEHHHDEDVVQARTDASGNLSLTLESEGIWYLRTIHLVPSEEPGLTHESNWATLTFELGHTHGHDHAHHDHDHGHHHDHDHHEEDQLGIPSYVYWIGSFVLIIGLFLWFNRNNN